MLCKYFGLIILKNFAGLDFFHCSKLCTVLCTYLMDDMNSEHVGTIDVDTIASILPIGLAGFSIIERLLMYL